MITIPTDKINNIILDTNYNRENLCHAKYLKSQRLEKLHKSKTTFPPQNVCAALPHACA